MVFPGSNCDRETVEALGAAGFDASLAWHEAVPAGLDLYVLPGGFSYGDYLRPGAVAARSPAVDAVRRAHADGAHVLGLCNGFQVLQEAGLLPGVLLANVPAGFRCRWTTLGPRAAAGSFGAAMGEGEVRWPIAHSTGRLHLSDDDRRAVWNEGRVLATYAGDDPNGSIDRIAGLTDATGRVAGLMPHPERAVDARLGSADGAAFFARLREEVARRGR